MKEGEIMKKVGEHNYYIQSSNSHLLNVLEDNYYMELGVVNIRFIDKLLKHQVLELSQLVYFEILNTGIGQITPTQSSDMYYQLNYLLSLRQKNSSNKFFLTCGTITYIDDAETEKYAPVVLIPIEIDYQNGKIIASDSPFPNRLLLKYMSKKIGEKNKDVTEVLNDRQIMEEQNRFIETYSNVAFSNVGQIDKYMEELGNEIGCTYAPLNYLTVCKVEYYDFTMNRTFFNPERSIYETPSEDIIKTYFKDIHAILPTSIDQKYVILKAAHGDSFAVDGRLGSGKTYTILNILADQIKKDKHILYVNQDLDNIWDLEKNLRFLDLGQYVYNMTKNLRDLTVPKIDLPPLSSQNFQSSDLDFMASFQNGLTEKINGFTIQYIMEKLAILKNSCFDMMSMDVETLLQKHEVDDLYEKLKKVEKATQVIDQYNHNIWKKLYISHNNITILEIIERTKKLYDTQITLNKEVEKFCKKYQLEIPRHIHDLDKMIGHIMSFNSIMPLAIWQNSQIRSEAISALSEIQTLSDSNYNATKYYEKNIDEQYEPGRAKAIWKELCGKNLKIELQEESEDTIYLNRLLSPDTKLQTIADKIQLNIEHLEELEKQIGTIFDTKNLSKTMDSSYFSFFQQIIELIDNHTILHSWSKWYLEDRSYFLELGEKVRKEFTKLQKIRENIEPYLLRFQDLYFEEIDSLMMNRQFAKLIRKYFDQKKVKKDHINLSDLIQDVKNYYTIGRELCTILMDTKYSERENIETQTKDFVAFYDFLSRLSDAHQELIIKLLKKNSNKGKVELEKVSQTLKTFSEECYQSDSLATLLKNYKIIISGEHGYEKKSGLLNNNIYIHKVIELKKELTLIFKGKKRIDTISLQELIHYDDVYLDVQKTLRQKEVKYEALLGHNYHGFDTIISDMGQTLEHFDNFITRIKKDADIVLLFQEPQLNGLIEGAIPLRNLCSDWINAFRAFSLCFKGGKTELQGNSFKDNIQILKEYVLSTNQVEHILHINDVIKLCKLYGLNQLCKKIENAVENDNLADSFLYITLTHLYDIIKQEKPYMLDFAAYENMFEQYETFEIDYCTKNIQALQKPEKKWTKSRLTNTKFNDYNKIVETLYRYVPIFLADLSIFNSDFDLEPFDLVIIDDGHLSSSNKYNRLVECKQGIVFGDKFFQSSIANTLMQRIGESYIVPYHNRYIRMSSKFNNLWSNNNRYVYNFDTQIIKQKVNSLAHFAIMVVEFFEKNHSHIINVVVGTEQTRREVYSHIVMILENNYSTSEIIEILCYNIRIINATCEGSRYVNDVIVFYNDFLKTEVNQKELIFKNFVVVSHAIHIYYIGSKIESQNKEILSNINATIGRVSHHAKSISDISSLIYQRLKAKNISVKRGFGYFDIILEEKNTVAVMIVGKNNDENYSLLDDYAYYYREYQRNGWIVEILYTGDLIHHFDETIDELIQLAGDGK